MSDPGLNDPGLNDPGLNDPGLNDPGLNDPGLNDPGLNDPGARSGPDPANRPESVDDGSVEDTTTPKRTNSGAGRALIAVYGVFALAATARAAVQIVTDFAEAPLAYLLSALAAVVYIVATFTLGRGTPRARRIALVAVVIELIGVLTVGTLSVLDPEAFPRATVWSVYGIGYGFVPLVLPVLGLLWLYQTRPVPSPESGPERQRHAG